MIFFFFLWRNTKRQWPHRSDWELSVPPPPSFDIPSIVFSHRQPRWRAVPLWNIHQLSGSGAATAAANINSWLTELSGGLGESLRGASARRLLERHFQLYKSRRPQTVGTLAQEKLQSGESDAEEVQEETPQHFFFTIFPEGKCWLLTLITLRFNCCDDWWGRLLSSAVSHLYSWKHF